MYVCFIQQANAQGPTGSNEKDEKQKLECLASYSLFGNVMSMRSVTLPGAQRDALLLSFADAKVWFYGYGHEYILVVNLPLALIQMFIY